MAEEEIPIRRASGRVKAAVNYEEKRLFQDMTGLPDDIKHDIKHEVVSVGDAEEESDDSENEELGSPSSDDIWCSPEILDTILEGSDKADINDDEDVCDLVEGTYYRNLLHRVGPAEFVVQTVDSGSITPLKLLTAFGVRIPADIGEDSIRKMELPLLVRAMTRELEKRAKLSYFSTINDAVNLIKRSTNIIVLTGAGISTSLGIPDFRSAGTGLYAMLERSHQITDAQEIFHLQAFKNDPSLFYSAAKAIMLHEPEHCSPTHAFIALLQAKGKLLTNYTQNIDSLEIKAGISRDKLVQCHGSFDTATCIRCQHKVDGSVIMPDIRAGKVPQCPKCLTAARDRIKDRKRKRAAKAKKDGSAKARRSRAEYEDESESDYEVVMASVGVLKPDIVFFGEGLPSRYHTRLMDHDRRKVDLVIVIGTSLKVEPVKDLVACVPSSVPQIYISRDPATTANFDIDLLGECDIVVAELCRRLRWELDHPMVPDDQIVEVKQVPGLNHRHIFTQVHPAQPK